MQLFAQRGFDGTTLSEIAAEAGISLSLLRHYFPRKAAIADELAALDSHVFENAVEQLGRAIREARTCHAFLAQLGSEYVEWVRRRQWLYTLWLQDHRELHIRQTVGPQVKRTYEVFAKHLTSMHDFSGEESDARFAIGMLFGSLFYATLVGPRIGVPPFATNDREIADLALTIATHITKR